MDIILTIITTVILVMVALHGLSTVETEKEEDQGWWTVFWGLFLLLAIMFPFIMINYL